MYKTDTYTSEFSSANDQFYWKMLISEVENSLNIEELKFKHYYSAHQALQRKVEFLSTDLSKSEKKFLIAQSELCKIEIKEMPSDYLMDGVFTLLNSSAEHLCNTKLKNLIKNYSFEQLSDDLIEKLLPIWRLQHKKINNSADFLINFISTAIEAKMKSDLLSASTDKLVKSIKKIENKRIKINKLRTKWKLLVDEMISSKTEEMELTTRNDSDFIIKTDILLESEDLYGTETEKGNTSTVIYGNKNEFCCLCSCLTF